MTFWLPYRYILPHSVGLPEEQREKIGKRRKKSRREDDGVCVGIFGGCVSVRNALSSPESRYKADLDDNKIK